MVIIIVVCGRIFENLRRDNILRYDKTRSLSYTLQKYYYAKMLKGTFFVSKAFDVQIPNAS